MDVEHVERREAGDGGGYIFSTDRCNFTNTGLIEKRHGADHRMILTVNTGREGAT